MTRLEASAWPLAGGSVCVFAFAVLLAGLPWQVTFGIVALAVCCWAVLAPVVAGAAIGGIAWLCVTGFDVHRLGDIRITGREDAVRAVVLVLAGVLAASAHTVAGHWQSQERTVHEAGPGRNQTSGGVLDTLPRLGVALFEQPLPVVHPIEERRDGRPGLHPADSGDFRRARPARESGRTAVSDEETV
jgi:hypothetical protein